MSIKSKRANGVLVDAMIKYRDEIRENVGEWYDVLFR